MSGERQPIALNLAKLVHWLLTRPRGVRVDTIMSELGIKPRTFRKYRELLQKQFEPFRRADGTSRVEEVRDGEARYLRLVEVGETAVEKDEFVARIAAIHLARQLFGFVAETDVGQALEDLMAEFKRRTKDSVFVYNHLLSNVDRMFYQVPYAPKDYSDQREIVRIILHCLVFTRRLEIDYDSASAGRRVMAVEPYSLMTHRGGLYLAARHVDHERPRTFAVDRILHARKLSDRFNYPSVSAFHPERYTEGCFGIFREEGAEPIEVELIFAAKRWLIADLTERRWHPTQCFERLADERLRMTFRVSSMVEVWPWIRSYGEDVEVVRPSPVEHS